MGIWARELPALVGIFSRPRLVSNCNTWSVRRCRSLRIDAMTVAWVAPLSDAGGNHLIEDQAGGEDVVAFESPQQSIAE
jgi:hypothetical protein